MKVRLTWLLILLWVVGLVPVSCSSPQPLPTAPTPIPTLIPATLPALTPTSRPAALGVSFPSRKPSAVKGAQLYEEQCAKCHGVDGRGTVPGARDFSDMDYLRGEPPARFYQIISDGRGTMIGFSDMLNVDQRWDVTFYIWHFAITPQILQQGKAIYEQNCVACHGANGKGTMPDSPDFTDIEWMALRTPRDFFQVVTEGKGAMPSWQGRLTPEERWAAIEYLRTFAYEPPPGPPTPTPITAPTQAMKPTVAPAHATATPVHEGAVTPTAKATIPSGDPENGQKLFVTSGCAACHGANAEGGVGPKLIGVEKDDAELFAAIKDGVPGTVMMGFGDRLSDQEIRDLIAFIRQL